MDRTPTGSEEDQRADGTGIGPRRHSSDSSRHSSDSGRGSRRTGSGDRSAGRGGLAPIARWAYLTGSRRAVVGLIGAVTFGGFLVLGLAGIVEVTRPERVATAFSTTITGVFTLVSISVSINQLVLSRILGSPGHIEERIESVHSFRRTVAGESDSVTVAPTEPAAFLEVVARSLRVHAEGVADAFGEHHDPQVREDVSSFVAELVDLTSRIDEGIGSDRLGLFDVLLPVLDNRYSAHVHTVDRIRATTADLSAAEERALSGLRSALVETNRTRHYFKTLYLHEALSSLSRFILLSGVASLLLSYVVILSYGAPAGDGGSWLLHLLAVSFSLAVALSPLGVLFAYGVRVATIASRTTTFGTFTPVEELP